MIFSIGYQGLPVPQFQAIVQDNNIDIVIDVRSKPNGRAFQYNRNALEVMLKEMGKAYLYKGDVLGGFTPCDLEALEWLTEIIHSGKRYLLLCFEADPRTCHRHYILSRYLGANGIEVTHILADGRKVYESDLNLQPSLL